MAFVIKIYVIDLQGPKRTKASINTNYLTCDPTGLGQKKKMSHGGNILRLSVATHRVPLTGSLFFIIIGKQVGSQRGICQ
jgi:hypothetical protein